MKNRLRIILLPVLFFVIAMIFTACATTEPDNMSSNPWNSPRGWEHGLPSSINEGR